MKRFAAAGTGNLPPAQQDVARSKEFALAAADRAAEAQELKDALAELTAPALHAPDLAALLTADPAIDALLATAREHAGKTAAALESVLERGGEAAKSALQRHQSLVAMVQRALVDAGGSAEDLNEFDAFAKAAQHHDSYKAALDTKRAERKALLERFDKLAMERLELVEVHRKGVAEICAQVTAHYDGRVLVSVEEEGRRGPLEGWVRGLSKPGLTRWWNDGAHSTVALSVLHAVLAELDSDRPDDAAEVAGRLGISPAVTSTLFEVLAAESSRMELWALRCPDRYRIQWVEQGVAKDLDELSGGRKVAVLLSLLLDSDDTTPLVIDQPEDQLDNRFLNDTIIPALRRLKGKRQVIFATHNANIVVNGDADRVIALEADAHNGRIYAQGAIEEPEVREAILRTLDGGEEAFALRRAKYGF